MYSLWWKSRPFSSVSSILMKPRTARSTMVDVMSRGWMPPDEPEQFGEPSGLFKNAFGNVNVNRHAAAHGQWVVGFELGGCAVDLGGGVALSRAVDAGEGLRAHGSVGRVGEVHTGTGVIDGHGPVVAGHVPIELVVAVEKTCAVADTVGDLDDARSIDGVRDVDFEIAIRAGNRGVVLQLRPVFVGNASDIDEEPVVSAVRPGIFDGDIAVNAVPFAYKFQGDGLVDQSATVRVDGDGVLKIGDAPGFCSRGNRKGKDAGEEQYERLRCGRCQPSKQQVPPLRSFRSAPVGMTEH
jgi:hypothetical protein